MNLSKKIPWQIALMNAITTPEALFAALELDPGYLEAAHLAAAQFPLKVPLSFVKKIAKGQIEDPLLLQVLPLGSELIQTKGYTADPLAEKAANPIPGLLHKYKGRVLITLTPSCAINCRYCFRRHFPYAENNVSKLGWQSLFDYIAKDSSINEVILSGGDPLLANDHMLADFTSNLEKINHLKRIRIHTRLPIVLPERITPECINWFKNLPLKTIVVIHCNHPNEIDESVKAALYQLKEVGVTLLNQSVLLKKVNDNAETLAALSEALFEAHVLPYYLHVPDKVQGTAHFDLPRPEAQRIYGELLKILPGFLVPKMVCEQPFMGHKTILLAE